MIDAVAARLLRSSYRVVIIKQFARGLTQEEKKKKKEEANQVRSRLQDFVGSNFKVALRLAVVVFLGARRDQHFGGCCRGQREARGKFAHTGHVYWLRSALLLFCHSQAKRRVHLSAFSDTRHPVVARSFVEPAKERTASTKSCAASDCITFALHCIGWSKSKQLIATAKGGPVTYPGPRLGILCVNLGT